MKIYLVNGICISNSKVIGAQEIDLDNSYKIEELMHKKIVFFRGKYVGYTVPQLEELNNSLAFYNAIKENNHLKQSIINLEQYIIEQEIKKI